MYSIAPPYSLGKLIDWKRSAQPIRTDTFYDWGLAPYSLGKLIDWKLSVPVLDTIVLVSLPTR